MISEYINRRDVQNILSKYYPDAGPTTEQILHNINRDVKSVPAADVVEKEKYDRLLENAIIVSAALQKYQKSDVVEVRNE